MIVLICKIRAIMYATDTLYILHKKKYDKKSCLKIHCQQKVFSWRGKYFYLPRKKVFPAEVYKKAPPVFVYRQKRLILMLWNLFDTKTLNFLYHSSSGEL